MMGRWMDGQMDRFVTKGVQALRLVGFEVMRKFYNCADGSVHS